MQSRATRVQGKARQARLATAKTAKTVPAMSIRLMCTPTQIAALDLAAETAWNQALEAGTVGSDSEADAILNSTLEGEADAAIMARDWSKAIRLASAINM